MVKNIGTILKKDYCPKCFTLVEWNVAQDEFTAMGNRYVICPECGSRINANDAQVMTGENESGGNGLPEVTAEDNGNVLTVVNGAWDKASPSGGGKGVKVLYLDISDTSSTPPVAGFFETIDPGHGPVYYTFDELLELYSNNVLLCVGIGDTTAMISYHEAFDKYDKSSFGVGSLIYEIASYDNKMAIAAFTIYDDNTISASLDYLYFAEQ